MCLFPKIIRNRKYMENKKNGGVIPAILDKRTEYVPVGCGKCMECKKQKSRNWSVRLQEEIRENKNGKFVTMTFSERSLIELGEGIKGLSGYEYDNEIAKKGVRRYLERWRKKYKKSVRHWFVTELGQTKTERIHIHGLIWSDEVEDIKKIWKYGSVWIGDYVNNKTINYIVKYINKVDEKHKEYNSKIMTSAGIGSGYMKRNDSKANKYKGDKTREEYTTRQGVKMGMPIYYRNQLWNDEEREKLWIKKLDEQVRYVNGIKIDISTEKGEEEYWKVLKQEQKKNKRLGFGNNEINWERRKYENERRNIKKMERIKQQEVVEAQKRELLKIIPNENISDIF